MKRIFIIHGWASKPEENWFPWLSAKLQALGHEAFVPTMPNSEYPDPEEWVAKIAEIVGKPDENTYFVGHSMGCSAIIRYLVTLPSEVSVGGAVFVAGFVLPLAPPGGKWLNEASERVASDWADNVIDLPKAKQHLPKSIAIFSDDDPWVSLANKELFAGGLGSEITVLGGAGHMNETAGFTKLPQAFEALLSIIK